MKRQLFLTLIIIVLSATHSYSSSGKAGENINWELDSKGILTFNGTGEMKDFVQTPYNPAIVKAVEVNEGITTIGENAFKNCNNLTCVTLPSTLKDIKKNAFAGCKNLASISIPYGVTTIGNGAFSGCVLFIEMDIPGSVKTIGEKAFRGCKNLVKIRIPSSVVSLGKEAFKDCQYIEKISELPDFITSNTAGIYNLNFAAVRNYWADKESFVAVETTATPNERPAEKKPDKTAAPKTSDVDVSIPRTNIQNKNTFAVVIANEHYANMEDVPFALNDGKTFRTYCEYTLGVPRENIFYYPDATSGIMREILSDLEMANKIIGKDMKVIFYYSGHGAPDPSTKEGYLIPVDARSVNPSVCLPLSMLYKSLGDLNVELTTIFLDACFSGGERNGGTLMAENGERLVKITQKNIEPSGRMVVFSATGGDETALPYMEKGHGIFTYFLLKKLKDTAGSTSLAELADYIKSKVPSTAFAQGRKYQTPTVSTSSKIKNDWHSQRLNSTKK